jgi:hypothetical protein
VLEKCEIHKTVSPENLKKKDHLEDISEEEMIILILIIK